MIETKANLTCPMCSNTYEVEMPNNYCQIRFQCVKCGKNIIPKKHDCCIFCSYADRNCPPMQNETINIDKPLPVTD
jgi:hypothetical protein